MSSNAAIIVAAGTSQRFGQDKLIALVQGQPLISYSVKAFAKVPSIQEIVLVVGPGREELFLDYLQQIKTSCSKKITIVSGGENRCESVQCGLRALSESLVEWVAIHDAARPLVTCPMIELCFQKAREYGAAALAARVTDTLHRATKNALAEETIDRTHLWAMQTPQVFRRADLASLESSKENQHLTDDVSLLLKKGMKTYLVENRKPNIKVTYPEDLDVVSALLISKN